MPFFVIARIPSASLQIVSENSPSRNSPLSAAGKLRLKEVKMRRKKKNNSQNTGEVFYTEAQLSGNTMKKKKSHKLRNGLLIVVGVVVVSFTALMLMPESEPSMQDIVLALYDEDENVVVEREPSDESTGDFPAQFDLRDYGYVTPVKDQTPWGSCWVFGTVAAAETSILSSLDLTYEETGLDLSEHQIGYFSGTGLSDGSSQDGEGMHTLFDVSPMDAGGTTAEATTLLASGVGIAPESMIPYRGKDGNTVDDEDGDPLNYSTEDDWSIPEEYRFVHNYELMSADVLLSPAVYTGNIGETSADKEEREANYKGYDQGATDTMKDVLLSGRAITVAICADNYSPYAEDAEEKIPSYINTADNHWTHFTYDGSPSNHEVTIVGWDDTISREDFLDHTDDPDGDGEAHLPEGDGAWIVKNSWGSDYSSFPNASPWGIEDEEGYSTGYFYISYYDRSLSDMQAYLFDTDMADTADTIIDQYDFLASGQEMSWTGKNKISTANVFTAEADGVLRSVMCKTDAENIEVELECYLLEDDFKTPCDGESAASGELTFEHAGYHRLEIDDGGLEVKKGQKYAVVVTQKQTYEDQEYYRMFINYGFDKDRTEDYNDKVREANPDLTEEELIEGDYFRNEYAVSVVNPGESYLYVGKVDKWVDWSEFLDTMCSIDGLDSYDYFGGLAFDNFPIKGYLDVTNLEDAPQMPTESYLEEQ